MLQLKNWTKCITMQTGSEVAETEMKPGSTNKGYLPKEDHMLNTR